MGVTIGPQLITVSFTGRNGTGPISVPGVKVGDRFVYLYSTSVGNVNVITGGSPYMEVIISVDDQVQQTDVANYSTYTFNGVLVR